MIRFVLAIFAVAGVLCAVILLPPVGEWGLFGTRVATNDQTADGVDVTRNVEPTFSETGELLDGGYTLNIDATTLEQAVAGVVSALQGTATAPLSPLQALVVSGLKAGLPDTDIDASISAAAVAGEISVPAALVTVDGRIDTLAFLAAIDKAARTAQVPTPVSLGAEPELVETPVVPEAITSPDPRFHVVAPGDSLGSIASEFYGNTRYDDLIFEANREVLASPDDLNVGQRLVIPYQ